MKIEDIARHDADDKAREGTYSRQKVLIVSRVGGRGRRIATKMGARSKRCLCNPIFRPIGAGRPISVHLPPPPRAFSLYVLYLFM